MGPTFGVGNGDDRGPSATRSKGSDVPTWHLFIVGFVITILIGVPIGIVWVKFIIWLLGL